MRVFASPTRCTNVWMELTPANMEWLASASLVDWHTRKKRVKSTIEGVPDLTSDLCKYKKRPNGMIMSIAYTNFKGERKTHQASIPKNVQCQETFERMCLDLEQQMLCFYESNHYGSDELLDVSDPATVDE